MKGLIHCHSDNSRYDSGMSVKTLVKKARELGYEAVGLTDHGTLSGMDDFIAEAQKEGIKPIYGVELYIKEYGTDERRKHLVLLAEDDLGIQGVNKVVTESNRHIEKGKPIVSRESLKDFFGEGTLYHGHVIATSACIAGVVASECLYNLYVRKDIEKLKKKLKVSDGIDAYKKNKAFYAELTSKIDDLSVSKTQWQKLAKKTYKKKDNDLAKLAGTSEYEEAKRKLDKEKEETALAAQAIEKASKEISRSRATMKLLKERITAFESVYEFNKRYYEKIEELEKSIKTEEDLYNAAKKEALAYQELFGKGNFFLELQYHGYIDEGKETELKAMPLVVKIGEETGIPLSVATDAHMPDGSEESIRVRYLMRAIQFAQSKKLPDINPGDTQLYLKSEEELIKSLRLIAPLDKIQEAVLNTYEICDRCNYKFDGGSHYPKFSCENADKSLREMAEANIPMKFPGGFPENYRERLDYELGVIADMGYSDYFLIVQDFLAFGRKLGYLSNASLQYLRDNIKNLSLNELCSFVDSNKEKIGFVVGAGRGSAAGSLTAYLIGITSVIDPIKYGLLFERFLNKERVSMPDVDSDFSPEIRDLVVEYCRKKYGEDSVANIMTKGYAAPKSSVRNVARIIGLEKGKPDYYLSLANRICKFIPDKPGTSFDTCIDILNKEFEKDPDAMEVLKEAKLIEGTFMNYGMHAAGVIIADGNPISDYVALMRDDKSGGMKVQCDMVQAEGVHGLLKFDFLGLRNLDIITKAIRGIQIKTGKIIDVEKLSFEEKVFSEIFAKGKTGSVFQFESEGMKSMLKKFKPDCFEDLIALVALYRPGPMDFIPGYIEAKYNPKSVNYLCDELKPILGKTYGSIVYQEQVMEIFQKLAGYSLSGADNVRRYMSKKKLEALAKEKEAFIYGDRARDIPGCIANGITEEAADKLFEQMLSFASYAFNKSHAAAYAYVSYITAWLKYFYPAEYMCAVLNCTDDITKLGLILSDCKEMGLEIHQPDVNISQLDFTVRGRKGIIFGLNSVKGTREGTSIKIMEERRKSPFLNFKDFLLRVAPDKATVENLIKAGAFDSFSKNRSSLNIAYEEITSYANKLTLKRKKLAEKEAVPEENRLKRDQTYIKKARSEVAIIENQLNTITIKDLPEDEKQKLLLEKEVLGFFVSGHPLDEYDTGKGVKPISSINSFSGNNQTIMGIIQGLKIMNRKSDGKKMACFNLEDKTGNITVWCFADAYEKEEEKIKENEIVKISGTLLKEDNGDEITVKIALRSIDKVEKNDIILYLDDIFIFNEAVAYLRKNGYLTTSGHGLHVFDKTFGEYRSTVYQVDRRVIEDNNYKFMELRN